MNDAILTIVEGQGEVLAVPVLLRRILFEFEVYDVHLPRPFRVHRNRIARPGEIEKAARQAVADRGRSGDFRVSAVLVVLDADEDCPARLASDLLERCKFVFPDLPFSVVLAKREFEAWFLGAKESLRGKRGIRMDATTPKNPESIRGAKERLTANMDGNRYVPTDDQPAFAEVFDLRLASERCASFRKLLRDVQGLLGELGRSVEFFC
jgi:hypothetical protein